MLTRIGILVLVTVWLGAVLSAAGGSAALAAEGAKGPLSTEEVRALVDGAPAETDMPDVDAVVLFDGTYIEYAGGLVTLRRQRLVKVFTEWAIDHVGDPRLAFDGARQELKVHASRTYLLDGSTVDTPENGYNEVTPSSVALSRDHLNIREMVVTHVGLERGVSILLDYSVTDTSPLDFPFNRMFFLLDEFPVLEKVIVMEGELQAEVVNPSPAGLSVGLHDYPQPERDGDGLTWRMKDLPARPRHAHHRLGDQIPWLAVASARIGLSSMQAWPALLLNLGRLISEAAGEPGDLAAVLGALEEEKPFLTEREALERIAEMATERTALLRYNPWVFTPVPRSVSECLETSTATPAERAALMLACCRARGLEADMVLPARWGSLSSDVPALEALADPLIRVRDPHGPTLWIDPADGSVTAQHYVTGGITYFVVGPHGAEPVVAKEETSEIRLGVFWDLDQGEGKAEIRITGPITRTLDWREPEKLVRSWAEGWCDSAEVTDLKILSTNPDGFRFIVSLDAPLPEADDRGRTSVDLPLPPLEMTELLPDRIDLSRSETDGVLFFPAPVHTDIRWKIKPPEGLKLLPGPSVEMEWEDGSVVIRREDQTPFLDVVFDLRLGGRPIIPEEYGGYRKLFIEATDPRLTRLIFAEEEEEE